jgi:predicted outer membrane repeat protein
VGSYDDWRAAIEEGGDEVVFCGGFVLQKFDLEPLLIVRDVDIRCLERCTLFGMAPYLEIGGVLTRARIHNVKFQNSLNATAVVVSTMTSLSVTTFCETEFASNRALSGESGGAIATAIHSGVVNVVSSVFTDNSATRGGAIFSEGHMLNIMNSRFVYNKASSIGSAIYVGDGTNIAISATTFILNSIEEGNEQFTEANDYAIVVHPSMSIRDNLRLGETIDNGSNQVVMSGNCDGFWFMSSQECVVFQSMQRV